ncbi:hypothetical protein [Acinetobacter baumannii]|uniref:hypothetical protein n=1 Tax=Acinetobacter baumannii TaxID=470 RepID=UPI0025A26BC7|nr:hypothetical protein [Acinetobacter baumannii]
MTRSPLMDNCKEYLDPKYGYALVKSSIDMPVHPTWIEIPAGATTAIYYVPTKKVYFWKGEDVHWDTGEWMDCKAAQLTTVTEFLERNESRIVWKRPTQDPALISGADAELVAQAKKFITSDHLNRFEAAEAHLEGHPVQFMLANGDFIDITSDTTLGIFEKDGGYSFRLKPQTVKLELELPKPFEPKVGEWFYYLSAEHEDGYGSRRMHDDTPKYLMSLGAYRTEDEIKQVVEQLRKIRGTNS